MWKAVVTEQFYQRLMFDWRKLHYDSFEQLHIILDCLGILGSNFEFVEEKVVHNRLREDVDYLTYFWCICQE